MLFKSWLCEMNQTFDSDLSVCVCVQLSNTVVHTSG